ncbi:MAG: hypothetical protein K6T91_06185 [Firmicutes bacterium]|nr:hypothetical protein [Bacillota bacterium]
MRVAGGSPKIFPEEIIGKSKEAVDSQLDILRGRIRKYPSQSLLAAFGIGLVLGFLVRRL